MRWVRREIEAPAGALWALLTDPERWPSWGPTVRRAEVDGDGEFETGATGVVTTVVAVRLPFEITACDRESMRWAWKVAGVPASDQTVQALGPTRSLVGGTVPRGLRFGLAAS